MKTRSVKQILLPIVLAAVQAAPAMARPVPDSTFTIQGYLGGEKEGVKIYLRYEQQLDSTLLQNGHFAFTGTVSEPVHAQMWVEPAKDKKENANRNSISFFLDPTALEVTSFESLQGAVVSGGPTEAAQQVWTKLQEPLQQQIGEAQRRKYNNRDNEDSVLTITKEIEQLYTEVAHLEIQFITRFPSSYVSWELMKGNSYGINPTLLAPMLDALDPKFKTSEEAKDIAKRLAIAQRTWIGQPALEFTQPDQKGQPVTLSSFRGKYVLVDFWASWCGWCRIENPNVVKAYNQYKDKGFTVLSVSIDDAKDKDKWIAAIKEDKLPWQQVCDLKGRQNEAAQLYGIKGIPQNVLIDPNGIIVAKNLRGDNLLLKLHELMDHPAE